VPGVDAESGRWRGVAGETSGSRPAEIWGDMARGGEIWRDMARRAAAGLRRARREAREGEERHGGRLSPRRGQSCLRARVGAVAQCPRGKSTAQSSAGVAASEGWQPPKAHREL